MCGAQSAKIMPLHGTRKAFTDTLTRNIDLLTYNKMIRDQFSANIQQGIRETRNSLTRFFGSTLALAK